jgi:hypothetical protein
MPETGESLVHALTGLPHLGYRVAFCNQPRPDARRDLADVAAHEIVQPDSVELVFPGRLSDSDFHLALKRSKRSAGINARD